MSLYLTFSVAVHAVHRQVLVNTSAHTSIGDSPSVLLLPIFSSSDVTLVKPLHVSVYSLFMAKRNVYIYRHFPGYVITTYVNNSY